MPQNSTKRCRHTAVVLVMMTVLLFVCPLKSAAIPVSEYQQQLNDAIASLETLLKHQEEHQSEFSPGFIETVETIRKTLPEQQTIELGADVYQVDNSSLHKLLDELKQAASDEQPEKARSLLAMLQALEQRVAERQQPGPTMESREQAKAKLESILARPDYATETKGPNALTRLLQDFLRWFAKLFPKPQSRQAGGATWLTQIAQILVLIIALFVIGYVVKVLLKRFKHSGKVKTRKKREPRIVLGERLEPEETATDLLSEAEALARRGELRAAIRKAYIALLVELGERKLISLAQHKTNRDYLNSLRNVPPLHSSMRGLTESFERHWYGFAETTQNDWQDFRAGYRATLQTKN
jgi:Domain of unknown function (DUF4129)